jgi:hypothetical protein
MNIHEMQRLYHLAKEDLFDFSPEFITQLQIVSLYGDKLRSDITKYLADKLAKKLNVPSIRVPWSKMKAEDIINWPSDLEFVPAHQMNTEDLKLLYKLAVRDLLDFSPKFLDRIGRRRLAHNR